MQQLKRIFCFLLLIMCAQAWAKPITLEEIPPVLQPWSDWVLYDEPTHTCPFLFNQQEARICAWPTQLSIDVQTDKVYFTQHWQVFAPSMIPLPGDAQLWPQQVQVNGEYYPLTEQQQTPMIALSEGIYEVKGFLSYSGMLSSIKIPAQTGLIQLTQHNKRVEHPRIDDTGYLWLQTQDSSSGAQALQLRVFRKVLQAVPMQVQTLIELDVSGPAREVQLGPVLLPGTIPMRLYSALPAQLSENGLLRLQLRPGKWQVEISERYAQTVDTLKRAEVGPPWPAEEIWVFDLDPQLGGLHISNVPSVDPTQTLLPQVWRSLPAYRVLVADSVLLSKVPNEHLTENQLTLNRHMWLDFSGKLWTVEDELQGQMLSGWRLSLKPPFFLGRFSLDNQEQLITVLENSEGEKIPGVEVRQGQLSAQAMSMIKNTVHMALTGWQESFNRVSTTLSLPPGWQLLTAIGVDELKGSVLSQWSLFDIFIVLLITLAITSVLGKKWGFLAFFMLLLTYHAMGLFILIWLNVILVLWAMQWFSDTRAAGVLKIYRDLSFVLLAVVIVWQSSVSIMNGFYPQILATPEIPVLSAPLELTEDRHLAEARPMMKESKEINPFAVPLDAKTQTGPAKPQWEWTQVQLDWHSAVSPDKQIYLLLISPFIMRVLTLVQIILFIAMGLQLWNARGKKLQMNINSARGNAMIWPLIAMLYMGFATTPAYASDIPDSELLNDLKSRLLAPDDCLPQCATIGAVLVNVTADDLYLSLQVDALSRVAVPIPGRSAYWQADQVFVNQMPASALSWQEDTLMVHLDKGHHTIMVYGRAHDMDKISFDFSLNPHWLEVSAPEWFVEGLDNQQLSGKTLHLLRRERGKENEMTAIPPFVRVVRNLSLGLTGEVTTTIERISPVAGAIQLNIPLLAHESVTTPGILVHNNQAHITFAPHQREVTWQSTLSNYNDLTLFAPETSSWVEEWQVQIAPIWHPTITGIVALAQTQYDIWQSVWQPWPSQSVHIQLNRLPALNGSTLTLDQVNVMTTHHARGSEVNMQALLRSTLSGQHTLVLPSDVQLQSVRINGMPQTVQNQQHINLAIGPGNNWIDMVWQTSKSAGLIARTPLLDWGMPAYNIHLGLNIPSDRWVVALGGSGYGPALLYWLWGIGAIVLAVILGKRSHTLLTTSQWLILLLGLSLATPFLGLWVIVALVLCSLYSKFSPHLSVKLQRMTQVGLGLLCIAAVAILIQAMIFGLRNMPDMHIIPSALSAQISADYVWFQDFSANIWPRAWVISMPLWVYRGLMLLWSLWVVMTLLRLMVKANVLGRKPSA